MVDYSVLNSDDVDQYINMDKMEKIVSAWSEIFDSVSVDGRLDGKFGTDSRILRRKSLRQQRQLQQRKQPQRSQMTAQRRKTFQRLH